MALAFPNASRSYDATRNAVRFWGHDSAMEWSFFVTADALKRVQPGDGRGRGRHARRVRLPSRRICAAAEKLYSRGRKGSYELGAADL